MNQLTSEGQQIINNIAQRYNFSPDAVFSMLQSVINGNGSMAQFNHREFGGSGQWMRGGMIMLGDMFNNGLKNSVGGLCQELANLIANQPGLIQSGSFQSQSQGNQEQSNFGGNYSNTGGQQQQNNSGPSYTQDIHQDADIFVALEKLACLKDKGILTDSEYSTKKAELLARL